MITFVYAVLVFLVLRFSVTLFNFLSNPKLGYYGKHFTDKVSIIIILSKEKDDAQELLDSIEKQDYKDIEVLIKPVSENEKAVADRAVGTYLLFLDANTVINKGLINSLIYRTKVFNLSLLCLIPTRQFRGFCAWTIYPLADFVLMNLFPLRLVRISNQQAIAKVNEACLFFPTEAYKRNFGHERMGGKNSVEVLLANKFIYANTNCNDKAGFTKQGKQLLRIFGNNVPVMVIYLVLVIAGPIVMLLNFNPVFVVLPLGLIFLSRIMISFLTVQNPLVNILFHPLQMLMLLYLLIRTAWAKVLTSGKHKI